MAQRVSFIIKTMSEEWLVFNCATVEINPWPYPGSFFRDAAAFAC